MIKLSYFLDQRTCSKGGQAIIKIRISHNSSSSFYSTSIGISPKEWNAKKNLVVKREDATMLNERLSLIWSTCNDVIDELINDDRLAYLNANNVRDAFKSRLDVSDDIDSKSFVTGYLNVCEEKNGRTKEIYLTALKRVLEYVTKKKDKIENLKKESAAKTLKYEDINLTWLAEFDNHLGKTSPSPNARGITLRCVRHVMLYAYNHGYTENYPFKLYSIKRVETVKRSLTVEDLRELFNYPVEPHQQYFLDMFKLIFCLIGINTADLCNLDRISPKGRIEYGRAKTHRHYSIYVEPEARIIIDRYRGERKLLNCLDRYKNSKHFMQYTNRHLQEIGPFEWGISDKRNHLPTKVINALHPDITTYWARHTWATIAADLDIPKEVISEALGHSMGSRITAVYINFDLAKVDIANRLVLDWVLYGKYTSWYQAMEDYRKRREQERIEASKVFTINHNVI